MEVQTFTGSVVSAHTGEGSNIASNTDANGEIFKIMIVVQHSTGSMDRKRSVQVKAFLFDHDTAVES